MNRDLRGIKNPFYGKHHTEEAKRKMSESHCNMSKEQKEKIGKISKQRWKEMSKEKKDMLLKPWVEAGQKAAHQLLKGEKLSKEHKEKISKANKGRWENATAKEKERMLNNWLLAGQKANRGRKLSQGHKNKISKWSRERRHSEKTKKKIAESHKGIKFSEKRRRNISRSLSLYWSKKSFKEKKDKMRKPTIASQKANPSSIEIAICKVLDLLNVSYQTQYKIGKWYTDIYIPNRKLVIECNGEYWHSLPHRIERDKEFQEYCDKNNYKLAWIWEKEIRENPKLALKNALGGVL